MACSYGDIDPAYDRLQASGVDIVQPISESSEYGFRNFFVNGPDGLLIEIVDAKPVPEGLWR